MTYDAARNLLRDGTGTGSHSYTWDAEGRLATIASPSGGSAIATYNYNAVGQRVQASGTGVGPYPVFQYYDAFGNLGYHGDTVTWGYAPFPPVNGKVYGKYYGNTLFIHSNALGSTGTTTWQDGSWVSSEIYDPWGQRWATSGSLLDERFAGIDNVRDAESGLDQTPNRMFASSYGRWLSPDPLAGDVTNPQSLNRYASVMNNPINFTDPTGLQQGQTSWTGNCTPYGYTSGCNWGGGATSNTNTMAASGACMAGEYGCDSSSGFGEDIFDKLAAFAPGSGFVPITARGAAAGCPECYYNPLTDARWDPSEHDPTDFFKTLGAVGLPPWANGARVAARYMTTPIKVTTNPVLRPVIDPKQVPEDALPENWMVRAVKVIGQVGSVLLDDMGIMYDMIIIVDPREIPGKGIPKTQHD
jgi:RHS repeat-associated protein